MSRFPQKFSWPSMISHDLPWSLMTMKKSQTLYHALQVPVWSSACLSPWPHLLTLPSYSVSRHPDLYPGLSAGNTIYSIRSSKDRLSFFAQIIAQNHQLGEATPADPLKYQATTKTYVEDFTMSPFFICLIRLAIIQDIVHYWWLASF